MMSSEESRDAILFEDVASSRASSSEQEKVSPPPRILLDEKLPGPLYGLPAIDTDSRYLHTRPPGHLRSRRTLRREQTQFELELLSHKALWNADLPIHSLPAEVLLLIFAQHMPALLPGKLPCDWYDVPDERPLRPWARLMQVCRHWCALIRNGAFFWRDVIISENTRWFHLALSRLGGVSMRIYLACDCDLSAVLPMLDPHTDRIERLIVAKAIYNVDAPHLDLFLSHSFPVLQGLRVTIFSSPGSVGSNIYCNSPLRWLDLNGTSLPWTKSVLANLEVLSLAMCRSSTPAVPFLDFLDVLEHGQRLQYLNLTGFLSAALNPQISAPHERIVTLPVLKHLQCCDVPANVARLMTHLRTPAASHIRLMGECNLSVPSTAHSSLLPQDYLTQFPFLQSITRASLDVAGEENVFHFSHSTGISFELHLIKDDWDHELTNWFTMGLSQLPALLGPALTELELYGALDISPAVWDRVFDSFPALQKLVVHEYNSGLPIAMLRSLAAAPMRSVPHGADYTGAGTGRAARVRCPSLRHLRLNCWAWSRRAFRQILECLRVRAAHGASRLEYFGADEDKWGPEMLPLLEKYRAQFLVVVDKFELDGWYH